MKLAKKLADGVEKTLWKGVWQRVANGEIGPNDKKEAHQIHRGIWRGTVKVWTPLGLYKEMKRLADSFGNDWEKNEKHYYLGFFVPFFTMKYVGILLFLQVGQNSAVRQVARACAGI